MFIILKKPSQAMKITTTKTRTNISFSSRFENFDLQNSIYAISRKYNAQVNIYNNAIGGKTISYNRSHVIENTGFGGAITFHSHSCNHLVSSQEMVNLLLSNGMKISESLIEAPRTIRVKDGSPYKCENIFLYSLKKLKREIFA